MTPRQSDELSRQNSSQALSPETSFLRKDDAAVLQIAQQCCSADKKVLPQERQSRSSVRRPEETQKYGHHRALKEFDSSRRKRRVKPDEGIEASHASGVSDRS